MKITPSPREKGKNGARGKEAIEGGRGENLGNELGLLEE